MKSLRILHLEDSGADAKLIQAALKNGGLHSEINRVETQGAYVSALQAGNIDLILADYQLPSFGGAEALELARQHQPAVPFIFVTGALGEEIAIDTLKRGATDYVLKQRLSRLVPAVSRALAETDERRQRQQAQAEVGKLNRDLQQRIEELETLLNVAPIGIAVARDPECRNIQVNPAGATLLGIAPSDNASKSASHGLPFRLLRNGQEVPDDQLPMQRSARTGEVIVNEEFEVVRGDGSGVTLLEYASPLHDENGRVRGSLGIWVDISAYKHSEAALRQAREQAERLSRVKDEFLATLSHELRTPLTPILGWVRMMLSGRLQESDVKRGATVIERNVHALTALVEDLLDVSRIISGKLRIDLAPTDLCTVINAALETVRSAADAKGIRVTARAEGRIMVSADAARLQQVVWNLLTNAIKFTPRGGTVSVACKLEGENAKVIVSDTGEGIDPSYLPRVFDRFSQAESSSTRRHGGLGLGLSIVRHLVELHGGAASADSAGAGKGATFTVRLPVLKAGEDISAGAGERQQNSEEPPLRGLKVLVVDDEADTREFVTFALATAGAEVVTAVSADDGLQAFKSALPSVVVADLSMPSKDGFSLIAALRHESSRVPVLALTALARSEDRERSLAAGFDYFMTKPVDPRELVSVVAALHAGSRSV